MVKSRKPYLRNILKRLFDLQMYCERELNADAALQEILDFLCMAKGVKPVFVTGRGIDNPNWISGIIKIAKEAGYYVQNGKFWDAYEWPADIPTWYAKDTLALIKSFSAVYITRTIKNKNVNL